MFERLLKRKTIVTGHYGSGKTEFSVSLAMMLKKAGTLPDNPYSNIAIVDLDVVNPYFRSRECSELLGKAGIPVYGSAYGTQVTAEIPEIGATVRTPLEDSSTKVIIDLGGNDSGAQIINQFSKYFTCDDTVVTAVVNANRPETCNYEGIYKHIRAIENATKLTVTHIVNNTHLLRETTVSDIQKGHTLCMKLCEKTGKVLLCDCYPDGIVNADKLSGLSKTLMPLGLYMRPTWL